MNTQCNHEWRYALELFFQTGTRYVCSKCGLKVECFEGRDSQIEAKLKQKNGYAEEKNAICSPFMISELWRLQK